MLAETQISSSSSHVHQMGLEFRAGNGDGAWVGAAFCAFAGPGCSSIGDGFLSELGPFRVTTSESLTLNEHSWNKGANIVFVESPVNVGFSYSSTASDYSSFSDSQTGRQEKNSTDFCVLSLVLSALLPRRLQPFLQACPSAGRMLA
jgi:hypothetical protein